MTIGTFEAQVLAFAVNEWMQAHNQQPVSSVGYVDSAGQTIQGVATEDVVGSLPSSPALSSRACQAAAADATAPLSGVSAKLIPFAGGVCVITLQTSDATTFDATATNSLGRVAGAVGGGHPLLVEVDDQNGNPLIIKSWAPGIDGIALNRTWVKSGLADPGLIHH